MDIGEMALLANKDDVIQTAKGWWVNITAEEWCAIAAEDWKGYPQVKTYLKLFKAELIAALPALQQAVLLQQSTASTKPVPPPLAAMKDRK